MESRNPAENHAIPDAERRLPHWSTDVFPNLLSAFHYSRRRKASASLEPRRSITAWAFGSSFQTPKGVCLIGAAGAKPGAASGRRIPDAERRLPHWSADAGEIAIVGDDKFQTPKGVCLIGAHLPKESPPPASKIPDAERRLPHWSIYARRFRARMSHIPDAERRLPHWSSLLISASRASL